MPTGGSCKRRRSSRRRSAAGTTSRMCFWIFGVAKKDLGRVEIELDYENTPLTSENFRELCTHQTGIGYRGSIFHRIVPGFLCQGGDIDRQDGTGGRSIYGATFDDESFDGWKHSGPGMVGMANKGPNTNNSQFYILTSEKPAPWLDGEHVVFGRVVKGMEVVHAIEADRADEGSELHQALLEKAKLEPVGDTERQIHPAPRTLSSFTIVDCGEVVDNKVAAPETMAEVAAATTTV
eukprot:INCI4246.1.p1 GENE.INCI4246.1~~INCI4246.1.p1  ORF type:complete len:236 (-),score=26.49 INCI4246.1:357-1064(-)